MAKIFEGKIPLGSSFKVTGGQPLDCRAVVEYLSDLTSSSEWGDKGATLYNGAIIAVVENSSAYQLKDKNYYTDLAKGWKKLGADINIVKKEGSAVDITTQENADGSVTITIGLIPDTVVSESSDNVVTSKGIASAMTYNEEVIAAAMAMLNASAGFTKNAVFQSDVPALSGLSMQEAIDETYNFTHSMVPFVATVTRASDLNYTTPSESLVGLSWIRFGNTGSHMNGMRLTFCHLTSDKTDVDDAYTEIVIGNVAISNGQLYQSTGSDNLINVVTRSCTTSTGTFGDWKYGFKVSKGQVDGIDELFKPIVISVGEPVKVGETCTTVSVPTNLKTLSVGNYFYLNVDKLVYWYDQVSIVKPNTVYDIVESLPTANASAKQYVKILNNDAQYEYKETEDLGMTYTDVNSIPTANESATEFIRIKWVKTQVSYRLSSQIAGITYVEKSELPYPDEDDSSSYIKVMQASGDYNYYEKMKLEIPQYRYYQLVQTSENTFKYYELQSAQYGQKPMFIGYTTTNESGENTRVRAYDATVTYFVEFSD